MSQLFARFQSNDIAGSLPASFGQRLDVLLRVVSINGFHRPDLHGVAANECLDRDDDSVENADLPGIGHSVQHGDHPILLRVEPLLGPDDDFCAFSHWFPQNPASMCGNIQNVAPNLGSTPKVQIPWDVFARPSRNPHASTRVTNPTRPNGQPPQRTPDPQDAQLLRREFHSVSRDPNRANGDAGPNRPPRPHPASLTLLRPS